MRGSDPGHRRGSVGGAPMPAVGGRPQGTSRPRAVPPHRRIRDQAGRPARVRALRLLRAPPAGRRRLRGGRATLTHEGDGWPDRQRHGRPDGRRDAHLRDWLAVGRWDRRPGGGSRVHRPAAALYADPCRHRDAHLRVRNPAPRPGPQPRDPLRTRTARPQGRATRGRGPGLVGLVGFPRGRLLLLRGRPPGPARRFLPRGPRNHDRDRGPLGLWQDHHRAHHRTLLRRGCWTRARWRWGRARLGDRRPHGAAVPRLPGRLPLRRHSRGQRTCRQPRRYPGGH